MVITMFRLRLLASFISFVLVLFVVPSSVYAAGQTVCVDPGHGGSDTGAVVSKNGVTLYERDLNLDIAQRFATLLTNAGYNPVLTRTDNATELGNTDRAVICNNAHASVLVSIHLNSSTKTNIDYSQTLYGKKNKDLAFAKVVNTSLQLGISNNGVTNFADGMLLKSDMPAVLTESVFLSNPTEFTALSDGTGNRQQQIAQVVFTGVNNWLISH